MVCMSGGCSRFLACGKCWRDKRKFFQCTFVLFELSLNRYNFTTNQSHHHYAIALDTVKYALH